MDDTINSYPVGIIVNPYSYWLAATPDRNVYCPDRYPTYGLLEIKCPVVDNITLGEKSGFLKMETCWKPQGIVTSVVSP